ncbi:MAG TPA: hypothetical protein DCQ84_08480 [Candidatus Competibacteraceae bacterium]|nr:hypothetical protein [Candidatus Competibacteraceae bacterium]
MKNPLTTEQVAELFGVTVRAVSNWQKDERDPLPVADRGVGVKSEYDPRAVFLWGLRRFGSADIIEVDRERALNLRADTRLKEIKEQQLRNELAPVALLTHALATLAAQVSAILETLPGLLKRARPDLTATDLETIKRELVKCQNACADIRINVDSADGESGEVGAGGVSETPAATAE